MTTLIIYIGAGFLAVLTLAFWLVNLISGGYLVGVIRWRFSPKEWKGRRVYFNGKMRTVIAEDYTYFYVQGWSYGIKKDARYLYVKK